MANVSSISYSKRASFLHWAQMLHTLLRLGIFVCPEFYRFWNPNPKIDFDFVENQKSIYLTFLIKNKIDFDLKKGKIQSNFIFLILILNGLSIRYSIGMWSEKNLHAGTL